MNKFKKLPKSVTKNSKIEICLDHGIKHFYQEEKIEVVLTSAN